MGVLDVFFSRLSAKPTLLWIAPFLCAPLLTACETPPPSRPVAAFTPPLMAAGEDAPVVRDAWDAVRIGTYDNAAFAQFFTEIGDYSVVSKTDRTMSLRQDDYGATIILEEMPADAPQARPPDAQSWEPGCYWSLMLRANDVPSIVADAAALGWLPKTPVAYLEFGPSKLNVVVLTHQKTGAQVQLYERLTTPIPEAYPDFRRFGVPFNIMQMASDRDATYRFFMDGLGFATFYHGEPYVSGEPEIMPLGIPVPMTTTVSYRASIVAPFEEMELGRFEMIEVMGGEAGLTGRDFSATCDSGSVGLTEVIYDVPHTNDIIEQLSEKGVAIDIDGGPVAIAPDGARIRFRHRR